MLRAHLASEPRLAQIVIGRDRLASPAARAIRSSLPVLFVAGYADLTTLREVGEEWIVQKPFRDDELKQKLRRFLLGRPDPKVVELPRRPR